MEDIIAELYRIKRIPRGRCNRGYSGDVKSLDRNLSEAISHLKSANLLIKFMKNNEIN